MKMFRKDEGFTLVELMVVVLIIGILVAIAIPVFNAAKANAQRRSCEANQRTLEGAAQTWVADDLANLITEVTVQKLVDGDFIKTTPACPAGGSAYEFNTTDGTLLDCDATGHSHF